MLKEISEKEFEDKVNIRFKNINEGFFRFNNKILKVNEECEEKYMISFMEQAFDLNGEDNAYVDFYYNYIDDEAKEKFEKLLCQEDKEFLENFKNQCNDKGVYYRLSKDSIPFITRLNINEVLFCTIYFTKKPMTIWGNYNKKLPIFYDSEKVLELYDIIAKNNKLIIEQN